MTAKKVVSNHCLCLVCHLGVYILKSSPTVLDRDSKTSNGTSHSSDFIIGKGDLFIFNLLF